MEELFTVELTKEEISSAIIQLGARIDSLKGIQKDYALKGNVEEVLSMEKFISIVVNTQNKMMEVAHR